MAGWKSEALFKKSKEIMPGGVNSPVRAFRAVNQNPVLLRGQKVQRYMMLMAVNIQTMCVHGDQEYLDMQTAV